MIHLVIDAILVVLVPVAYIVGLNRNRAAARAEIEAAKAAILAKVEAAKK